MEKPKKITITADCTVSYERIVNLLVDHLPEDFEYNMDIFDLLTVVRDIDKKLRG